MCDLHDEIDYQSQASFRYALREFLRFSEEVTGEVGITPQQYQTMLAIKTFGDEPVTIGALAESLLLYQHSVTTLVDRLETQGYLTRTVSRDDRRKIHVALTPRGDEVLRCLVGYHQNELRRLGDRLLEPLQRIARLPACPAP